MLNTPVLDTHASLVEQWGLGASLSGTPAHDLSYDLSPEASFLKAKTNCFKLKYPMLRVGKHYDDNDNTDIGVHFIHNLVERKLGTITGDGRFPVDAVRTAGNTADPRRGGVTAFRVSHGGKATSSLMIKPI